jgi:hypothetical protein
MRVALSVLVLLVLRTMNSQWSIEVCLHRSTSPSSHDSGMGIVGDPVRNNPHWSPPHRPGRSLIGASGSYLRKSFAGRPSRILVGRI